MPNYSFKSNLLFSIQEGGGCDIHPGLSPYPTLSVCQPHHVSCLLHHTSCQRPHASCQIHCMSCRPRCALCQPHGSEPEPLGQCKIFLSVFGTQLYFLLLNQYLKFCHKIMYNFTLVGHRQKVYIVFILQFKDLFLEKRRMNLTGKIVPCFMASLKMKLMVNI